MGRALSGLLLAAVIFGTAPVLQDVSAQDGTPLPGQLTQARVRIENRGASEAVPVSVEAVTSGVSPLPVQVEGAATVVIDPSSVVEVRNTQQQWEYQNIGIPAGADAVPVLNAAGVEGWETTGLAFSSNQGTVLVMKRPR